MYVWNTGPNKKDRADTRCIDIPKSCMCVTQANKIYKIVRRYVTIPNHHKVVLPGSSTSQPPHLLLPLRTFLFRLSSSGILQFPPCDCLLALLEVEKDLGGGSSPVLLCSRSSNILLIRVSSPAQGE